MMKITDSKRGVNTYAIHCTSLCWQKLIKVIRTCLLGHTDNTPFCRLLVPAVVPLLDTVIIHLLCPQRSAL